MIFLQDFTCTHLGHNFRKRNFGRAPSEDSDQPAHSRSLIRIFTGAFWIATDTKVFFMRTMKTLIRLRGCVDCFESSLGANARRYVIPRCDAYYHGHVV